MKTERPSLKRHQVAGELRQAIVTGEYPVGMLLPGEIELAQQFSVSRTTIRNALGALAGDSLIETRTGVGSFVTFDGMSLDRTPSWGRALASRGVETSIEVVRLERLVDPDLAAAVAATTFDFVAVDRIRRLADGTAISLERSRVPAVGALVESSEHGLLGDSLSQTMTAAGLVPTQGEQWIATAPLTAEDAGLLGRETGAWFLHSVRLARDTDGHFVEKVVSWLDPQHFRLHVTFGAGR